MCVCIYLYNENGERLVEVCSERRLSIGNTWFQRKLIQKYTRKGENGQERSVIDYVLVDEKSKNLLENVNVYRSAAGGMSDRYLMEAKVRMKGVQKREREEVIANRVMRVSELEKKKVRETFVILIVNEWYRIKTYKSFKCTRRMGNVLKHSNNMCSKGVWVQKYR